MEPMQKTALRPLHAAVAPPLDRPPVRETPPPPGEAATQPEPSSITIQQLTVPLALVGVLFVALYGTTFAFMMHRWATDPAFQHGWVILPIALTVTWFKRDRLRTLPIRSHRAGIWVIGFALLLHLFEKAVDLNGPSPLSIPFFVAGTVLHFFGGAFLRELIFPIAYLTFMIPIPGGFTELVSFPLRLLATNLSKVVVGLLGVNVQGAGMNIEFLQPNGREYIQLAVADPCSGLHSLMAIKALHAITAYLSRLRLGWKWVLFMCAIPIALLANLTRIVGIILIGAYWSRDIALGLFHTWSSPILFAIAFAILISIGRLLEWLTAPRTPSPSSS